MPPQGVAARRAAATLLHATTTMGQPLDAVLAGATRGLSAPDRALARGLALIALRRLPGIDATLDSVMATPLPADSRARQALRVALAGRYGLGTPDHAVIATTLAMLEGGPRRLAHGVLSAIFRTVEDLPPPVLPEAVAVRWEAAWGPEMCAAAAHSLIGIPPTDLRLADPGQTAQWSERLGGQALFPGHLRLADPRDLTTLPGFSEGRWWVQDAAAQIPALLLGDVAGQRVLDLCAAPGGKTLQLAASGADVTALDRGNRLKRLNENLARTGLSARIVDADLMAWEPDAQFDAILLDAPCSATGTFRRHPEVLLRAPALDRLVAVQAAMLARAAGWLSPGGRLVYAVCSLEPEEGEAHAAPDGLIADPVAHSALPSGLEPTAAGAVRVLPGRWAQADGFFMQRFVRPA